MRRMDIIEEGKLEDLKSEVLGRLKNIPHFKDLVFVALFGSRVHGTEVEGSDIDICCYYDLDKKKLNSLSLKIDSSFTEKYDISLFQLLPLQIRKEVLKGKLLYFTDRKKVFDIAYSTIKKYGSYEPLYRKVIS